MMARSGWRRPEPPALSVRVDARACAWTLQERGVVWEESIIMAPKSARFAFLSATIPNAKEFAEWVAKVSRARHFAAHHHTRLAQGASRASSSDERTPPLAALRRAHRGAAPPTASSSTRPLQLVASLWLCDRSPYPAAAACAGARLALPRRVHGLPPHAAAALHLPPGCGGTPGALPDPACLGPATLRAAGSFARSVARDRSSCLCPCPRHDVAARARHAQCLRWSSRHSRLSRHGACRR